MSKDIKLIPTHVDHARYLADNLREQDILEIMYACGSDPYEAIVTSIESSDECYTVMVDDMPAVMFGVKSYTVVSSNGLIWMLSTDEITDLSFRFIKHSKHVVKTLMGHRKRLYNYVWTGNAVSIKWLEWMGFKLNDPAPYGCQGEDFQYFEMVK